MRRILAILFTLLALSTQAQSSSCSLAQKLEDRGYVDIAKLDPSIAVDLMYASTDNFVGVNMYGDLKKAYLHPDAASALLKAHELLKAEYPSYRLLVKDAARPMSVQRTMFNAVKGTSKANYVANPSKGGGLHNYGIAVDITILDSNGNELPMGTPVDHLGVEANIDKEEQLVASGYMTAKELDNRRLLRRIMKKAGFQTIRTEWWHFQLMNRAKASKLYKRLDF